MTDLKQIKLLIVDDEEALRDALVFEFMRKGFTVLSAENGTAAFETFKANKIDLVLSDMRMPGGDGMSLLANIRAVDPKSPPVIFVTGFADVSEAECLERGAYRVIAKPFERKALVDSVFEALGLSPTQVKTP